MRHTKGVAARGASTTARCVAAVAVLISASALAMAETIHVPGDQPTIQAGIDAATHWDTVLVACGTYYEQDISVGTSLSLMSETGQAGCVTIDAEGGGPILYSGADYLRIVGITFTGGSQWYSWEAAGLTQYGGSLWVTDCTFSQNTGEGSGGMFCDGCDLTVTNCLFLENTGSSGAGLALSSSSAEITGCTFSGNIATGSGGGLWCNYDASVAITGCAFTGNTGDWGGGLCTSSDGGITISDCVFDGNDATYAGGGVSCESATLSGCSFTGNTADAAGGGACVGAATFTGCKFVGNTTWGINEDYGGGGVLCYDAPTTFVDCLLAGNTASYGGAVGCWSPDVTLDGCTLAFNSDGIGLWDGSTAALTNCIIAFSTEGEGVRCGNGSASLTCCDVFGNAAGDWVGCIASQSGVDGNIWLDPYFCDWAQWDFTIAEDSPCAAENNPECGLIGARDVGCEAGAPPAGQIAVSDTLLAFGQVCIGWPGSETVLVSNTGAGWLVVSEISADHPDFSADPTNMAVPPGDSRTVEVDFTPSSAGLIAGTLTIVSDDPEHPAVDVPLEGEGVGSTQIAVSDTLLAFGGVCVGVATWRSFVVTNDGLCPLMVSSISTNNGDFSVDITSFTLPPGDTQLVSAEFTPSSVGLITGTLTITSNDPDHPTLEITLEGEGLEGGRIAVSDTLLSFGSVIIGAARWDMVSVTNVGCDLLTVSDISIDHEDFSANITSFSVELEDSQEVVVWFAPSTSGLITATMTILSDDPDDPTLEVLLEGEGLVPPEIAVIPDSLYGDLLVGEMETQYVTIENTGASELVWSARAVERAAARDSRLADLTGIEILWDQRHGQTTSTHTTVVAQLVSRGATVTESYDRINDVLLSGYDVAWITDCSDNWWSEEVQALAAWVVQGGTLLLEGEDDPSVAVFNDILVALGAGIEYSTVNGTAGLTANIHPHQTTQGVDYVHLWYPRAHLSVVASPALPLIDDSAEVPNSVCSAVGFGRVVTMACELANNFHITHGNTELFVNQVFDWLARGSTCTWLACEPSSGTVAAGGSMDVAVTLDATELFGGDHLADVQVWSNDPDDPRTDIAVCLHVTGVPDIAISETFLGFGEIQVGATGAETLLVWNEGTDLLTVSDASCDHADFSVDPVSFTVPPEESQAVVVEFAPSTEGLITGTLTILSDDPDEGTVLVALGGTGTSATPVEYSLYATATESGTVMLRWTVPSLTGIDGFNVYRATSQDGPFACANDDVITPSTPGSFEDTDVWPETTFCYELRAVLTDGSEDVVGTPLACVTTGGELATRLYAAYPNPLTSRTNVQFDVRSHAGPVALAVYSITGQLVRRLASGPFDRGRHVAIWDGRDERGMAVSAGVYFVRLEAGGEVRRQKVAVVR